VGLADRVADGGGGDVVVIGRAGEAPTVSAVGAGVRVRGVAHVHCADRGSRLAVHAGDGVSGRVWIAVIAHVVRRDYHCGVGLADMSWTASYAWQVIVTR